MLGADSVFAANSATLSLSSNVVEMNVVPSQFSTASQTVTISTDNIGGYYVTMETATSSTDLTNNTTSTPIPTFSLPAGSETIPAILAGYGYGYSLDNGANFAPAPDPSGTGDLIFSDNTAGTFTKTLTFGVNADDHTESGTYENTFLLTAYVNYVPDCLPEKICYMGNGDDGTGTMADQDVTSNVATRLIAPNFSKSGYGFVSWNTEADGSGTNYGPGQRYQVGNVDSEGIKLYAQWMRATSILQNWSGCSNLSTGDIIVLSDFRDNNAYTVAKLADGNCWMVENMRINPKTANFSTANTNQPTQDFLRQTPISNATSTFCTTDDSACLDKVAYNLNNMNRNLPAVHVGENLAQVSWYSYGGTYNWYTATAGNGLASTSSGSTSGDICPAGWHLPTGGTNSDLTTLTQSINGNNLRNDLGYISYPNNFIYSGDFNTNVNTGRGIQGRYWTSTAATATTSYRLGYSAGGIKDGAYNRWAAFSVRCMVNTNNPSVMGNIHYDANGGTGTMANTTNVNLYMTAAELNAFQSSNGNSFTGWNTEADGSGVTVNDGDLVSEAAAAKNIASGGTLTLYATWGAAGSLSFDANDGYDEPGDITAYSDSSDWTFTIPASIPKRTDYTFLGWSTNQTATTADYIPGGTFTTSSDTNVLYAVWEAITCDPDTLCYNSNGAERGISIKKPIATGDTFTLDSPDYSKAGYGFVGWNTAVDGSGTFYGPNERITISGSYPSGLMLYAIWLASSGNLQDWNGCSSLSVGDTLALTDTRDNNAYTVTKLADNHCWMTENLRINPATATFTAANTNSPTSDFIAGAPTSAPSSTLCTENNSACMDRVAFYINDLDRNLPAAPALNNSSNSWYSYGMLYNWYTATAGNGTYSMPSGSVTGDICPSGWRLPTAGTNSSDYYLLGAAIANNSNSNWYKLLQYPNNFVLSGDHNGSADNGRGTYTRLWSATASSGNNAYRMGIQTNTITPKNNWNKWDGFTVRCIAQ